jgi:ferredoxin
MLTEGEDGNQLPPSSTEVLPGLLYFHRLPAASDRQEFIYMPIVVFLNEGRPVRVETGKTLLDAAMENGVPISHVCQGAGTCSTCRVEVVIGPENISPIEPNEIAYSMGPGVRLGCQAKVLGDCGVRVVVIPKAPIW